MALSAFHGYQDSIRWRLTKAGVEIEGSEVERTPGAPATVTRIWEAYAAAINQVARTYRVPCVLIIATIATETGGRPDAVRIEPGYRSDASTPHKVSIGLTQTLLSTARDVMRMSFDRSWLLDAAHAISAGTAYIAWQARMTQLDPPLVAAAYNAGRLVHQTGAQNRWKLRQYPLGTGQHCDRFVRFFNDAVVVLTHHTTRPSVGMEGFESPPAALSQARAPEQERSVQLHFGGGARPGDLSPYSRRVLEDILRAAGLRSATISSTARSAVEQARVMFQNLERYGVAAQRKLYSRPGNRVIDTYERRKAAGDEQDVLRAAMAQTIREVGPTRVSHHAADPAVLGVFDVAPGSIKNKVAFEQAVRADSRVRRFLTPPRDPGYHLEIPQGQR